jgi:hypothetical protein
MKTIFIIFIVYWSGFALAWIFGAYQIRKYRTNESPLAGALFSWFVFIILGIHELLCLVSKKYRDKISKEL